MICNFENDLFTDYDYAVFFSYDWCVKLSEWSFVFIWMASENWVDVVKLRFIDTEMESIVLLNCATFFEWLIKYSSVPAAAIATIKTNFTKFSSLWIYKA